MEWSEVHTAEGSAESWHDYMVKLMDPRVSNWPLMPSPWIPLSSAGVYLAVVVLGPKMMKGREPVNLKAIIVLYNFGLVLVSAYMFYEFFMSAVLARYSLVCQPVDYSNHPHALRMARVCWLYYVTKYIEFADTVFFILRKKNGQITVLHVYHHATMPIFWWSAVAYIAGGETFFHAMLNSGIHVLMYTYYGLAALGPHMQRYLWWKKYLTTLQLVQFGVIVIHLIPSLVVECSFPKGFTGLAICYAFSLIALFSNFYKKAYKSKPSEQRKTNDLHIGAACDESSGKRTHVD